MQTFELTEEIFNRLSVLLNGDITCSTQDIHFQNAGKENFEDCKLKVGDRTFDGVINRSDKDILIKERFSMGGILCNNIIMPPHSLIIRYVEGNLSNIIRYVEGNLSNFSVYMIITKKKIDIELIKDWITNQIVNNEDSYIDYVLDQKKIGVVPDSYSKWLTNGIPSEQFSDDDFETFLEFTDFFAFNKDVNTNDFSDDEKSYLQEFFIDALISIDKKYEKYNKVDEEEDDDEEYDDEGDSDDYEH